MHPGEVPEIGEVLDLARGVALPAVRPGGDHRPAAILKLGNPRQRPAGRLQGHPDKAVTLLRPERGHPCLRRHPGRILQLRDGNAAAVGAIAPPVIGAHDLIAADPAQRQRGTAVHAQVRHRPRPAVPPAPQHQRLPQQVSVHRLHGQACGERDRMPAGTLRPHVGEDPRGRHRQRPCLPSARNRGTSRPAEASGPISVSSRPRVLSSAVSCSEPVTDPTSW